MKRNYPQTISAIIDDIFKEKQMEDTLLMHRALSLWPQIVGASINRMTIARRVENGTMYIRINSSVVRHELMMHRTELLNALNSAAGANVITEIKFV